MPLIEPNLEPARRKADRFPFDRRDLHPHELRQKAHQGQQIGGEVRMQDWRTRGGFVVGDWGEDEAAGQHRRSQIGIATGMVDGWWADNRFMDEQSVLFDARTGLYVRWYFWLRVLDEANRAARYGEPFGLLLLDASGGTERQREEAAGAVPGVVRNTDIGGA